jgi:hypothetical protein
VFNIASEGDTLTSDEEKARRIQRQANACANCRWNERGLPERESSCRRCSSSLDSGRIPSSLALAILAIEEAGKISILRRLAVALADIEVSDVWKEYRSHTSKNVM